MTEIPSNQHITYQLQYRKCGKASCSTCRNTQGHGPYWYAYWRQGSRLRSGYIGKERTPHGQKPATSQAAKSKKSARATRSEKYTAATATAAHV
ncbi:DUF6788 family protein [Dictyobacter aurantiacus]|uniref:DUF6788 domain-containing protein n=1 Tax=Dictyobacter aurantiacus TaxID=1936993 RepID=A0A401ZHZ2_9CHLR|nr:DUF6788 family protein [Dictyobacter aurantiacus]GCE06467.1 hypothetical protein KDAU_37960 [Dictyobacter aurantiacus]